MRPKHFPLKTNKKCLTTWILTIKALRWNDLPPKLEPEISRPEDFTDPLRSIGQSQLIGSSTPAVMSFPISAN